MISDLFDCREPPVSDDQTSSPHTTDLATKTESEADASTPRIKERFRGYLPVVIDVETGGLNPQTDALLEIAAVLIKMDDDGTLYPGKSMRHHVEAFPGSIITEKALEINGIVPDSPLRAALPEAQALGKIFTMVREEQKAQECSRSILIGHNAFFDQHFVNAASERCGIKRNPFHPFSAIDTASISALTYGQTVLARAIAAAGIDWNGNEAHSALYDAEKTAELFCKIVNRYRDLGGWPL